MPDGPPPITGTSSDPYISMSRTLDGIFTDVAGLMANPDVCPDTCEYGHLAKTGLESNDRLTVMKTQAHLLMRVCEILNTGEVK